MTNHRIAVITAKNSVEAVHLLSAAVLADVIELRLDYWSTIDMAALAALRQQITLPVIFTLRKASQGGRCTMAEPQRLALLHQLAALAPEYLDIEYDTPAEWLREFQQRHPRIQLIGSYHNFVETPADLPALLQSLYHPAFSIYKLATFAQNILDTLRLLIFLKGACQNHRLIGLAMGEYGQISRILAPIVGSLFTYGCLDEESSVAPGQLTLSELTDIKACRSALFRIEYGCYWCCQYFRTNHAVKVATSFNFRRRRFRQSDCICASRKRGASHFM